jgi:hypothetical protein
VLADLSVYQGEEMKASRYAICSLFTAILLMPASSFAQLDSTSVSTPISSPVGGPLSDSSSSFAATTSTEIETGASNLLNPDARDVTTTDSVGADVSVTAMNPSLEKSVMVPPVLSLPDTYDQQDALTLTGAHRYSAPPLFGLLPPTRPVNTPEALAFSHVTLPVSRFNSTAFRVSANSINSNSFDPGAKARQAFSGNHVQAPVWGQSHLPESGMPANLPGGYTNMPSGMDVSSVQQVPGYPQSASAQQRIQGSQNSPLSLDRQRQLTEQSGLSPRYVVRNLSMSAVDTSNQLTPGGMNWSAWNTWPQDGFLNGTSLRLNTLGEGNIFSPDIFSPRLKGNARDLGTNNRMRIAREQANRISRLSETESVDSQTLNRLNQAYTLFPRTRRSQKQLRRSRYHNPLLNNDANSQYTPDPQY